MIHTLVRLLPLCGDALGHADLSLWQDRRYMLVTLHRPSNVDDAVLLGQIINVLLELSADIAVLFLIHPRTRAQIERLAMPGPTDNLHFLHPLGYMEFLALQSKAALVISDSGGIQEETTFLGIPCLTDGRTQSGQ